MNQEDIRTLNELKMLSLDMITRAGSGAPGLTLSMAPLVYTLFHRHLHIVANDPTWMNRDRLVVSCGAASSLVYAAYHLAGFAITRDDLMNYRRIGSLTPGFLEYGVTPGIDASSGLSGNGIATAVGMALGKRYLKNIIESEDERIKLLDYHIYVLCTEMELMEGITNEALSFAGVQNLSDLMILCDANSMSEDGPMSMTMQEEWARKCMAMGWYVDYLKDGLNIRDIDKAVAAAKKSGKPSIIFVKSVLGKESFVENNNISFTRPLTNDDIANLRKKWNLFLPPFEVSKDSILFFQKAIKERSDKKYRRWQEIYNKAQSNQNKQILNIISAIEKKEIEIDFNSDNYKINDGYRESLRESNLKIINIIAQKNNLFLGGSADSSASSQTYLNNTGDQSAKNPIGRNIWFGRRENAMAAILNGLALSGLKVFGSTKLAYADNMKASMRMTSLMNLPVTFIFTHDTISSSQDGPVMQPIEQLAMLHTIPNLICYRPADIIEVMGAWEAILKKKLPSALIITPNDSPKLPGSSAKNVLKGAYIIKKEKERIDGILISSGSELIYALQLSYDFEKLGIDTRVVSMPSMELFMSEGKNYEEELLPSNAKRIVIESSSSLLLTRFATSEEYVIGLNDFGFSGFPNEVLKQMSMDYETMKTRVENLLRK